MAELYPASPSEPHHLLRTLHAALPATIPDRAGWLRLAAMRGATPRHGPLAHDVLFPTPDAPRRHGLNVFGHGHDADVRVQVQAAVPRCAAFLRQLGPATWNAGIYQDATGVRLKLYLTGDLHRAVSHWPVGLPPCVPEALGVDLSGGAPARHRVYLRAEDPAAAVLEAGWAFPTPLPWPCTASWMSHCLLTAGVETAKRTRNWIFNVSAPLSALRDALPPNHRRALAHATRASPGPGLEWAPVALEADVYADGGTSLDWLLTVRRAK